MLKIINLALIVACLAFWPCQQIAANRLAPAPKEEAAPAGKRAAPQAEEQSAPVSDQPRQSPQAAGQPAPAGQGMPANHADGSQEEGQAAGQPSPDGQEGPTSQASRLPEAGQAQQAGAMQGSGEGKEGALMALGNLREDVKGEPLRIPDGSEDASFLQGNWSFDRAFVGPDGESLAADFYFDQSGKGKATLTDQNSNQYVAEAAADMNGKIMRISTSEFKNAITGKTYSPQFMACMNRSANIAECMGQDANGYAQWDGMKLIKSQAARAQAASSGNEAPLGQPPMSGEGNFVDLSPDGAELPPAIMESREKAGAGKKAASLADLAGDWQFSRDLARRDNGRSLGLQFHFDQNGKGYSVIKDSEGNESRADAEATLTSKGILRARTEAYKGGGKQDYYPTFMECRPGAQELECDVSNGWTRVNDGKLVSMKEESGQKAQAARIEDILQIDPAPQAATMEDLLAGMGEQASQSAPEAAAPSIAIPSSGAKMDFLEGKWRCNTGLARASDNSPVVLEFNFNKYGKGSAQIRETSGAIYSASAQGSLKNGVLRINTSEFRSRNKPGAYFKTFIECRDEGQQAVCAGENGGIHWADATFTRIK